MWKWIWPCVGGTPISQGLDTEIFDRTDYPYSDTFVREAIQNSLDARLDLTKPVIISFRFHKAGIGPRRNFLEDVINLRKKAGLPVLREWQDTRIDWITIEDFNARGLVGELNKRTGDFWNYWLNFGLSNKKGSDRGGRGIGRVTFLIASRIHTVLALTRRSTDGGVSGADGKIAACGMCLLKAMQGDTGFHSTHAYLASEEIKEGSIYQLYDTPEFHSELQEAFSLTGYEKKPDDSGLALVIPYPHPELTPDGILASAIEHFVPAIMSGSLVVRADQYQLDADTITDVAERVPLATVNAQALPNTSGKKLVLHCKAGKRGATACEKLLAEKPGLELYNLAGGITAWAQAGYDVKTSGKFFLPLDRQVQLTIGSGVLLGVILGYALHPAFFLLSAFFGLGLINAGLTGWCGMALLMAKMPWNKGNKPTASFCMTK